MSTCRMMRSRVILVFGISAAFAFLLKSPVLLSAKQSPGRPPKSMNASTEDLYERLSELEENRKSALAAADAAEVRASQADGATTSLDPAVAASAADSARSARSSAASSRESASRYA